MLSICVCVGQTTEQHITARAVNKADFLEQVGRNDVLNLDIQAGQAIIARRDCAVVKHIAVHIGVFYQKTCRFGVKQYDERCAVARVIEFDDFVIAVITAVSVAVAVTF